ncbi:hypothetical protein QTG54_010239 [Skeletonema marinoi]|uniref:Uncharacterized protein n=1 Tax=Skeletonema marinoi TaxID=267567 RepID=A0AAD8Y3L0_9STRA|nr:hypothetical protein QTG54_010239 [Skeletonema marinoi]
MIHNHTHHNHTDDDADNSSVDSNFDIEIPTITTTGSVDALILPHPDNLLQEKYSFTYLRNKIEDSGIETPRFLKYKFEGGIKPHTVLCCLLLGEYEAELQKQREQRKKNKKRKKQKYNKHLWGIFPFLVKVISFGYLHNQLNNPADYIRDQFFRVAHVIPTHVVPCTIRCPDVLRKKIKDKGLPVPNYFLDPDDPRQLPPHIALLVMLQDGRRMLEVIGGAGAIWGGAEVMKLRNADNAELWRWLSIGVGVFCFARFVTLNVPYKEDEGDILGPAGPWSLRLSLRLRAVCDHPTTPSAPKGKVV